MLRWDSSRLPRFAHAAVLVTLATLVTLAGLGAASCGADRDAVPPTRDVRAAASSDTSAGYVYVARRALGVVALAEARGLDGDVARRVIDHLADALDACATDAGRRGMLHPGALRVIAQIDAAGAVSGVNVKVAPEATANAILCVIAPLKLTAFPARADDAGDAPARGMAIEATWGTVRAL